MRDSTQTAHNLFYAFGHDEKIFDPANPDEGYWLREDLELCVKHFEQAKKKYLEATRKFEGKQRKIDLECQGKISLVKQEELVQENVLSAGMVGGALLCEKSKNNSLSALRSDLNPHVRAQQAEKIQREFETCVENFEKAKKLTSGV